MEIGNHRKRIWQLNNKYVIPTRNCKNSKS